MFISLRLIIFSVLFLSSIQTLSAVESRNQDLILDQAINRLDGLIQATQQSLEGQKKLRDRIMDYKKNLEIYLDKPQDNDLLLRVVKSAYRTLEAVKENHLEHLFDPDFIDELTVLSKPVNKRLIPKP